MCAKLCGLQPWRMLWLAGQVVEALQLSRATFAKIRQNLVWAFGYNAVGIPVAAGALLPAYGIAFTPSIAGVRLASLNPFSC
jgi:cation transport ATPase